MSLQWAFCIHHKTQMPQTAKATFYKLNKSTKAHVNFLEGLKMLLKYRVKSIS